MKIFLSWSGTSSRVVAEALNDWLPRVIQAVKPFLSSEIEKGAKWSNELDTALEGTNFGIVCLTPDNLESPWIHYEVGALSKQTSDSLIWTFLLDIKPTNIKQPLGKYQHTFAKKNELLKMLNSINRKLPEPLKESLLEETFNEFWPKLEEKLKQAAGLIEIGSKDDAQTPSEGIRDGVDKLDEILEMLRNQQRQKITISGNNIDDLCSRVVFSIPTGQANFSLKEIESILERYFSLAATVYMHNEINGFYVVIEFLPPGRWSEIRDTLKSMQETVKLLFREGNWTKPTGQSVKFTGLSPEF